MQRLATSLVVILCVMIGGLTVIAGPARAATPADVLATYHDIAGRVIYHRNGTFDGNNGFGWQKISQKHKITSYNAIGFIAHNPDGGTPEGKDRRYMAYANKKTCNVSHTLCTVDESIPVKLIVHYEHVDTYFGAVVNAELGAKTAYCVNDDSAHDCPPWVNGALRSSFSDSAGPMTSAHGVTSIVWTYEPLSSAGAEK